MFMVFELVIMNETNVWWEFHPSRLKNRLSNFIFSSKNIVGYIIVTSPVSAYTDRVIDCWGTVHCWNSCLSVVLAVRSVPSPPPYGRTWSRIPAAGQRSAAGRGRWHKLFLRAPRQTDGRTRSAKTGGNVCSPLVYDCLSHSRSSGGANSDVNCSRNVF